VSAHSPRKTWWQLLHSQWLLLLAIGLWCWAAWASPERALAALGVTLRTFGSVLPLVFAVMGLIGLIQSLTSPERVSRLLGREAGWRALWLAALCGMALIGPAYLIFPLLMSLHRQGARWAVVATVLASYAVKIQMIPLEVGFLGWRFSLARTLLTLIFAVPFGLAVEWLVEVRLSRCASTNR
jgi:uncharacterized membrane protein YraQ (UPF0718 family)